MLGLLWYVQRRVGKRMQRRRDDAEITVIGRRALGAKAQVVIVETDDRRYVLGVTEHGVNLIDSLPANHVTRPLQTSTHGNASTEPHDAHDDAHNDFASRLATERMASAEPQSLRRHRRPAHPTQPTKPAQAAPLSGSILSPQTWRQTADFLRRAR